MDRSSRDASAKAQVVLAVLASIAALNLLKMILVPLTVAVVLACILSPIASFFRKRLPYGPLAALALLLLMVVGSLYLASLTAESLVRATYTLPSDIERLAGQISGRITDLVRDRPELRAFLPEPGTIDRLGDTNRALLLDKLSYGLADFTTWLAQGLVVLVLVVFLLIESPMLTPKLVRFFSNTRIEAQSTGEAIGRITRQIRAYLITRSLLNIGLGLMVATELWVLDVRFSLILGVLAAITNFVPYLGQFIGGAVPTVVALGQNGSVKEAFVVAAVYLAMLGIVEYLITPLVLGRSLDLNGTTVLIACLFWANMWGLVGLVLAMPITVSLKVVFQVVPELNRWAELMSVDWQSPTLAAEISEAENTPISVAPSPREPNQHEHPTSKAPAVVAD